MSGEHDVFISYRREDGHIAGRLHDSLLHHFVIYLDLKLPGGREFTPETLSALRSVPVVVVVIGPRWISAGNIERLRSADDWIRRELEEALTRRDVLLIPVLVDEIDMPDTQGLPESLRPLCDRQAVRLRLDSWPRDVQALVSDIERGVMQAPQRAAGPRSPRDVAYLCDRRDQIRALEQLCEGAGRQHSLVCVLPGHKEEGHDGFLRRVSGSAGAHDRVLETGFNAQELGIEICPLELTSDPDPRRDPKGALCMALKKGLLQSSTVDDSILQKRLQNVPRPLVLTLLVLTYDVTTYRKGLLHELRDAWETLISGLPKPPAHTLVLWIDLMYDNPAPRRWWLGWRAPRAEAIATGLPQLPELKPLKEKEILHWMRLDSVKQVLSGHERVLRRLAHNPQHYLTPGELRMETFADVVQDLVKPKQWPT
jgi:hypothetical protein